MSPLIVRRRNLDRYGRVDGSINVVVAVLLFVLSELVEHFHCLFLSPLMVAMGSICAKKSEIESLASFQNILKNSTFIPVPDIYSISSHHLNGHDRTYEILITFFSFQAKNLEKICVYPLVNRS